MNVEPQQPAGEVHHRARAARSRRRCRCRSWPRATSRRGIRRAGRRCSSSGTAPVGPRPVRRPRWARHRAGCRGRPRCRLPAPAWPPPAAAPARPASPGCRRPQQPGHHAADEQHLHEGADAGVHAAGRRHGEEEQADHEVGRPERETGRQGQPADQGRVAVRAEVGGQQHGDPHAEHGAAGEQHRQPESNAHPCSIAVGSVRQDAQGAPAPRPRLRRSPVPRVGPAGRVAHGAGRRGGRDRHGAPGGRHVADGRGPDRRRGARPRSGGARRPRQGPGRARGGAPGRARGRGPGPTAQRHPRRRRAGAPRRRGAGRVRRQVLRALASLRLPDRGPPRARRPPRPRAGGGVAAAARRARR